jgi:hypothetical protein
MKDTRTFTVVEKAFAFDLARVARDGEMNILPACFRKINAYKIISRPIRGMVRRPAVTVLNQSELDFTGCIGFVDRPVSAPRFSSPVRENAEERTESNNCKRESLT